MFLFFKIVNGGNASHLYEGKKLLILISIKIYQKQPIIKRLFISKSEGPCCSKMLTTMTILFFILIIISLLLLCQMPVSAFPHMLEHRCCAGYSSLKHGFLFSVLCKQNYFIIYCFELMGIISDKGKISINHSKLVSDQTLDMITVCQKYTAHYIALCW